MMIILSWAFTLYVLTAFNCNAQKNFIYNGSFEELNECPISGFAFPAKGWHVLKGTPDLFASCVPAGEETGVPYNFEGTRNAISGGVYAGLFLIMHSPAIKRGYQLEESIYTKTIYSLRADNNYKLSFYISASDSSVFSVDSIYFSLSNTPPIKSKNANKIVEEYAIFEKSDIYGINIKFNSKKNWNLVEIEFTAKNDSNYLSVGLPRVSYSESQYNYDILHPLRSVTIQRKEMSAYYYIDDIKLVEMR